MVNGESNQIRKILININNQIRINLYNYTFKYKKHIIDIVPFSLYTYVPNNDYIRLKKKIIYLLRNQSGIHSCLLNNKKTSLVFNFGKNNETKITIPLNYLLNQTVIVIINILFINIEL